MKVTIGNAFALAMLDTNTDLTVMDVSKEQVVTMIKHGFTSVVGHEQAAQEYSTILGVNVPMNRTNFKLGANDVLVVGQFTGGRLPEGVTFTPEQELEIKYKWRIIGHSELIKRMFVPEQQETLLTKIKNKLKRLLTR